MRLWLESSINKLDVCRWLMHIGRNIYYSATYMHYLRVQGTYPLLFNENPSTGLTTETAEIMLCNALLMQASFIDDSSLKIEH